MIEVEQIIQNTATHKRRLRDITDGCLRDSRKSTRRNEEPTNNIYDKHCINVFFYSKNCFRLVSDGCFKLKCRLSTTIVQK